MKTYSSLVLRGLSLLVAVAAAGGWVRSYFVADHVQWPVDPTRQTLSFIDSRTVETTPGRLNFKEHTAFM